ncbi:hypothetical protein, partial [Dictyobacter formicarum]|uniref:hypothetical protein n=1 Tax=Dictyobacter formicarum TaxID=2778368 RepID=UPI00191654D4
ITISVFSDAFFLTLRDLQQRKEYHKGRLAIGIAGAVGPDKLIKDPDISPFNISKPINMHDFSFTETRTTYRFIEKFSPQVDEDVHAHIYGWTQGHLI